MPDKTNRSAPDGATPTAPDGWRLSQTTNGHYFCEREAGTDDHGGETCFAHETADAAIHEAEEFIKRVRAEHGRAESIADSLAEDFDAWSKTERVRAIIRHSVAGKVKRRSLMELAFAEGARVGYQLGAIVAKSKAREALADGEADVLARVFGDPTGGGR